MVALATEPTTHDTLFATECRKDERGETQELERVDVGQSRRHCHEGFAAQRGVGVFNVGVDEGDAHEAALLFRRVGLDRSEVDGGRDRLQEEGSSLLLKQGVGVAAELGLLAGEAGRRIRARVVCGIGRTTPGLQDDRVADGV